MTQPFRWQSSLDSYSKLVAVTFETENDKETALKAFWCHESPLYGVTRESIDSMTMALPVQALELLKNADVNFTVKEIISAAELSPSERAELRRRRA